MLSLKTAAFLCLAFASLAAVAEDVDNTAINKRDQNESALTPMDQAKGSDRDVDLTRKIRQLIVKDKAMSSDAKNVKIITLAGKATLRGPVDSAEEKMRVGKHAAKVVGAIHVDNQLEVKASN